MNELDKEVNTIIMQEIGLDIGNGGKLYDQDTSMEIKINGMNVMAPGLYGGRQSIEFDPHNNRKMMSQLFGYFVNKYSEETDIDVLTYYNVDNRDKLNTGKVECKMSNDQTITSDSYQRDSLKYADIIIQLNGGDPSCLKKYDTPQEIKTIKKKTNIGRSKNNGKTN